jgi:hypothetical protein
MYFKQKRLVDKKYLESARDMACLICGSRGDVVMHHLRIGIGGGVGLKPGDDCCVPLCYCHHAEINQGEASFVKKWRYIFGNDPVSFAKLLYKRYKSAK